MAYTIKTSTAPATEPVTLTEVKQHLKISTSSHDDLLLDLVTATRLQLERYTRRAFITQTLVLHSDGIPNQGSQKWWDGTKQGSLTELTRTERYLEIPRPPLQSVTSVKYYDLDDTINTFSTSNYVVDSSNEPGRVILKQGQTWPVNIRPFKTLEVTFVAGFGSASDVPMALRRAMLMLISEHFNRSDGSITSESIDNASRSYADPRSGSGLSAVVEALVSPWRVAML